MALARAHAIVTARSTTTTRARGRRWRWTTTTRRGVGRVGDRARANARAGRETTLDGRDRGRARGRGGGYGTRVRAMSTASGSEDAKGGGVEGIEENVDAETRLTAAALTLRTIESTVRDVPMALVLSLAAGIWAQSVNLGGTFVLAFFRVHTVPVVAAVFGAGVAVWKFACATFVRVAVLERAVGSTNLSSSTFKFSLVTFGEAWDILKAAKSSLARLLACDFRRTLSLAWNSLITIPIPYLGVIRMLDFAIAGAVVINEREKSPKEALKRSQELMYGYRLLLLRTAFLCSVVASVLVGGVIGIFLLLVPTLPKVMLPPVDPVTGTIATADALSGFINGAAFDRVWVMGTPVERFATMALLVCGLSMSFLFTLGLRELVSLFYAETSARYVPPPPPSESANASGDSFWKRVQFWKKSKTSSS